MKGKPKNAKKPNLHLKLYSCNEDKCNEHYIREEDAENEKPKPLQLPDVSKNLFVIARHCRVGLQKS